MRSSRRFYVILLPVFVALAQTSSALVLIGSGDGHEASLTGRLDLVLHHHGIPRSPHHHDDSDGYVGASSDTHHDDDGTAPEPDHVVRDATDPGLLREAGFAAANQGPLCFVVGWTPTAGGAISRTLQRPRRPMSGPAPPLFALATIILRI
jgi:hypothetical protein